MHLYIPIEPPHTPAPSPGPEQDNPARLQYLASILHGCTPSELRFISLSIAPLLKRDFLRDLPIELGLHILSYIHDPDTLAYLSQVSKSWRQVVRDESVWRRMCDLYHFPTGIRPTNSRNEPLKELEEFADKPMDPALEWLASRPSEIRDPPLSSSSFHRFKYHYMTCRFPSPSKPLSNGTISTELATRRASVTRILCPDGVHRAGRGSDHLGCT